MIKASSITNFSPTILARLKAETRAEHVALEQDLDLMNHALTIDAYCHRLRMFYGFYAPLESGLASNGDSSALHGRLNKAELLKNDLLFLDRTQTDFAICRFLPPLKTQADVLGCLYVIEGATLGGRLITKHAQNTLDIYPTTGGSFFYGYGENSAMMWHGMRQLLVSAAFDLKTEDAIVSNAIATFSSLRSWYQSGEPEKTSLTL